MQVLKFGGTSVANAEAIQKVVEITSKSVDRDRTILVVSAIRGCTDSLVRIGNLASERDESYKDVIDDLQRQHHQIIKELLPVEKHDESREVCDSLFDSLRSIAQGVYLLGELSPTSLDAIQGFGELWSSKIIAARVAISITRERVFFHLGTFEKSLWLSNTESLSSVTSWLGRSLKPIVA